MVRADFRYFPAAGASDTRDIVPLASFTENETEVSFFNREMYETFKLDPQVFFPFLHAFPLHCVLTTGTQRHDGKADAFLHFVRVHSQ